jgi:hypothetical protein
VKRGGRVAFPTASNPNQSADRAFGCLHTMPRQARANSQRCA